MNRTIYSNKYIPIYRLAAVETVVFNVSGVLRRGWLARSLPGWLAGSLAGWLAGWLAG